MLVLSNGNTCTFYCKTAKIVKVIKIDTQKRHENIYVQQFLFCRNVRLKVGLSISQKQLITTFI